MPNPQPAFHDITPADIANLAAVFPPPPPDVVLRLFNERHEVLASQLRPIVNRVRKPRRKK
jgi:hypothetical protein